MTISRITASVFRSLSKDIIEALAGIGVTTLTSFAARSPIVEQGGFWGGTKIVDDPVDTFSFLVPSDVADKVVSLLVTVGRLDLPGRGSVFAVNVELPHRDNANHVNQVLVDGIETVQLSNNVIRSFLLDGAARRRTRAIRTRSGRLQHGCSSSLYTRC